MSETTAVGFPLKPLPAFLRVANRVAERLGVLSPVLTPERLVEAACRSAGLPDRLPAHVGEALEVLCRSLHDEANLHWFGRMNQQNLIVTGLASLLRVEQAFRDDPSLAQTELLPPVVVTGLPRSGTTFLHRLLSAPDEAAGVELYRHIYPLPHTPVDWRKLDVAAKFQAWKMASRTYDLDAIHFVRPDLPDECNFGMRVAMRSMIFWATAPSYGYMRWLLSRDLREAYQLYRKILLVHQRQLPGRRLTLKCPQHLAWLPALAEALPEALIVQTHRDPAEAVPSECKLILSLQALSTHRLDWRRTVENNRARLTTYADRAVAFADSDMGARVLHVDYRALVRDPVGVAGDIHTRFGLPFSDAQRAALSSFTAENRQHKHGHNRYSMGQFELSAEQVAADFRPYVERFLGGRADRERSDARRAGA